MGTHLDVRRRADPVGGEQDATGVRRAFDALRMQPAATLLLGRCTPTAAFSRRDALLPGAERAWAAARELGFEPVTRHVGGHLAAYDEGSLVVHLWSHHDEPARDLQRRFIVLSYALRSAIESLGVSGARVGPVPGEYCDGAWSINLDGVAKVAGTGQRISKHGWMWSAVVAVRRSSHVCDVLRHCYADLGLDLDPTTIGFLDSQRPCLTVAETGDAVAQAISLATIEHRLLG